MKRAIITDIIQVQAFGGGHKHYDYVVLNSAAGKVEIPRHDFHFPIELGKQVTIDYVQIGNGYRFIARELKSS